MGVDADLVGIVGIEGGVGIVIDTDTPSDSGVFVSAGPGSGANVGIAMQGGWLARDIEGWGSDLDVNAGKVSPVVNLDDKGLNGIAVGYGPGVGVSFSATKTGTLSVGTVWSWIKRSVGF